jgi:hypothetical protein
VNMRQTGMNHAHDVNFLLLLPALFCAKFDPMNSTHELKQRISDLLAVYEKIAASGEVNMLDKEVLKKHCLDIYTLVLQLDESLALQSRPETSPFADMRPVSEDTFSEAIPDEPVYKPFVETLKEVEQKEISLDELAARIEAAAVNQSTYDEPLTEPVPVVEEPVSIPEPVVVKPVEEKPVPQPVAEMIPEPVERVKKDEFRSVEKTEMPVERESSFNEKLAQIKVEQPEKLHVEPRIDNLKTAISLNKKIAFVNILFHENVVEYAKSIDKINNAVDINEALRYFMELKYQYNWDEKDELAKELEQLIKRRFS